MLSMIVFLALCWYGMMAIHELGHVIGAWLTGGVVERVVLHPLAISRTDLSVNPHPLPVAWCGPVFGCLLPILIWLVARRLVGKVSHLARFFAGFCCVANGAYLGIGSFESIGDAGDLLKHQCPVGYLWLFGVAMIPIGFALWNGLGPAFGIVKRQSAPSETESSTGS
jgi:hypothetical protein